MKQGLERLSEANPPDPGKLAFATAWFSFLNVMSRPVTRNGPVSQASLAYFPQTGDR